MLDFPKFQLRLPRTHTTRIGERPSYSPVAETGNSMEGLNEDAATVKLEAAVLPMVSEELCWTGMRGGLHKLYIYGHSWLPTANTADRLLLTA